MGKSFPIKGFNQVEIHKITIDCDEELKAIAEAAIDEAKFDWKYIKLSPTEIPFVGAVQEVCFGRVMYNRDLPNALKQRGEELGFKGGFKFADPLTALCFVCISKKRRQHQLIVLFADNDQLECLCLYGGIGECYLRVYEYDPDDNWDKAACFLAILAE